MNVTTCDKSPNSAGVTVIVIAWTFLVCAQLEQLCCQSQLPLKWRDTCIAPLSEGRKLKRLKLNVQKADCRQTLTIILTTSLTLFSTLTHTLMLSWVISSFWAFDLFNSRFFWTAPTFIIRMSRKDSSCLKANIWHLRSASAVLG